MRTALVLIFFFPWITVPAFSQQQAVLFQPDSVRKKAVAVAVEHNLKIDGKLTETAWQEGVPVSGFYQVEPFQGQPLRTRTEVRLAYNRRFLYIAAINYDSLGRRALRAPDFKRDFNPGAHDYFGVSIDGFNDRRNAMTVLTNAYGTQRDLLAFDDLFTDVDWDGLWTVRTSRTDSAWVAEIAIPWQTLRYARSTDTTQSWGVNFFRSRRSINEFSAWSPFPRAFSPNRMEYAGELSGLKPPPPLPNVRIQPYLLGSGDWYRGLPETDRRGIKVGGDVKWAINPNAILDLTFNTDFAQADVDRQVNNLSRFSVFFPERRPFFLENASLFGAGLAPDNVGFAGCVAGGSMTIKPFFSRTIGLTTSADGISRTVPIQAGARFVYRSPTQNYGGLAIRQAGTADSPVNDFLVGRYSRNLGSQSRVGTLFTFRNQHADSGLDSRQNGVAAVDGFFRFSPALSYRTMLLASTSFSENRRGMAGYSQFFYRSNQFVGWLTQSVVTKGFSPDMGFVARTDVLANTPGFYLINRGAWLPRWIREFDPGVYVEVYHKLSTGQLQEVQFIVNPVWFTLQAGGFFGLFVKSAFQRLDAGDARPLNLNLRSDSYNYLRFAFAIGNDPSKKVSYQVVGETGPYYDGRLRYGQALVRVSPVPQFSVTANAEINQFRRVGTDRFSETVQLYGLESRLALTPRFQLISFYQHNTYTSRDDWNLRLAWEFRPLSFLYVIYNRGVASGRSPSERLTEQHLIGKISYLKQF